MLFNKKCDICGQQLTDASGHWSILHSDHGINQNPGVHMRVCGYCNQESLKLLSELRDKMRAKEAE